MSRCKHIVSSDQGFIELYNDDDAYYTQQFSTRQEVEEFISELRDEMDEVWPEGTNEKELQEHFRQEWIKNNPPQEPKPLTDQQKRMIEALVKIANYEDSHGVCGSVAQNPGF
jgi:hypothetical protein